jgi:hypothetical protein
MKDVVAASIERGSFDREQIGYACDNTELCWVATRIGADATELAWTKVAALDATMNALVERRERLPKRGCIGGIRREDKMREPTCGSLTNAWQSTEKRDEVPDGITGIVRVAHLCSA